MTLFAARALDTDVSVTTDDQAVCEAAAAIIATYPAPIGAPTLCYELSVAHGTITRDGEVIARGFTQDAFAPCFERDLYDQVIERARPSFMVHAAALARDERAILLFGASGAGKTTLSRALIARGARYLTDEIAAVDRALHVRGVPRPLGAGPTSPPEDPEAAQLRGRMHGYRFVARDGTEVDVPLFVLAKEHVRHEPAAVAAIIHLRHSKVDAPGVRDLRRAEALGALWDERLRAGADEFERAVDLVERVPAFELTTRTVEGACRDLNHALAGVW